MGEHEGSVRDARGAAESIFSYPSALLTIQGLSGVIFTCEDIMFTRESSPGIYIVKWTMIGQMAIATALPGFNDLGRSVIPDFLSRNRFFLQLSTHCPKNELEIGVGS